MTLVHVLYSILVHKALQQRLGSFYTYIILNSNQKKHMALCFNHVALALGREM